MVNGYVCLYTDTWFVNVKHKYIDVYDFFTICFYQNKLSPFWYGYVVN